MEIETETTFTLSKDGQTIELTINEIADFIGTLLDHEKLELHLAYEDVFHVRLGTAYDCVYLVLNDLNYDDDDDDLESENYDDDDFEETNWQQEGL